jgi:hypothetical protein
MPSREAIKPMVSAELQSAPDVRIGRVELLDECPSPSMIDLSILRASIRSFGSGRLAVPCELRYRRAALSSLLESMVGVSTP